MTRSIATSLLVCGALCANAAPSSADTITFANSSLDGGTMGATVSLTGGLADAVSRTIPTLGFDIAGACGAGAIYGCVTIAAGDVEGAESAEAALDEYLSVGAGLGSTDGGSASLTEGGGSSSQAHRLPPWGSRDSIRTSASI